MTFLRYLVNGDKFTFAKCGLDIKRNLLQAPERKDGKPGKALLYFEDEDEVVAFICETLGDVNCAQCGIFVIRNNGNVVYATREMVGREDVIDAYQITFHYGECDFTEIGVVAIESKLHWYGLMVEVEQHKYAVIEN